MTLVRALVARDVLRSAVFDADRQLSMGVDSKTVYAGLKRRISRLEPRADYQKVRWD